jgi:hypothetical protein
VAHWLRNTALIKSLNSWTTITNPLLFIVQVSIDFILYCKQQILSWSRNSLLLYNTKLHHRVHKRQQAIRHCLELIQYSSHPETHFSNIYLDSIIHLHGVIQPKFYICIHCLSMHAICPAHIIHILITLTILVKASHYTATVSQLEQAILLLNTKLFHVNRTSCFHEN